MKKDREKHGLRGPVKKVQVETARFKEQDGQLVQEPWFGHEMTFDPDGNVLEYRTRNPDGSTWRSTYEYAPAGKLMATRSYDSQDELMGETLYLYDSEGKLMAERRGFQETKISPLVTYYYDGEGRKTKSEFFDVPLASNVMFHIEGTDGGFGSGGAKKIRTLYDLQGEAVEVKLYDSDGDLLTRVQLTRDERGNPLEVDHFAGDAIPLAQCSSESCSLDEQPPLTGEQMAEIRAEMSRLLPPGSVISKQLHQYDVEGKLVESKSIVMEQMERRVFQYDGFGNKREERSFDDQGVLKSRAIFDRQYDDRGNWTKEIVSVASEAEPETGTGRPDNSTRRQITYYDVSPGPPMPADLTPTFLKK